MTPRGGTRFFLWSIQTRFVVKYPLSGVLINLVTWWVKAGNQCNQGLWFIVIAGGVVGGWVWWADGSRRWVFLLCIASS